MSLKEIERHSRKMSTPNIEPRAINATPWSGTGNRHKYIGESGKGMLNTDPIGIGIDEADAHRGMLNPPDMREHYTWSKYVDCKHSLPQGVAPDIDSNPNETIKLMPDSLHKVIHPLFK